jgi:hypothetical protein
MDDSRVSPAVKNLKYSAEAIDVRRWFERRLIAWPLWGLPNVLTKSHS